MGPDEFVSRLHKSIILENLTTYRDLFESTKSQDASDPYWIRALSMYATLDELERSVFFEVIRQTIVDTLSNTFAILDGVIHLEGQNGEFHLSLGDSSDKMNGALQDCLLAIEEEN